VAFPVKEGQARFGLYYGNPNALRPRTDWTPKRGLMLEIRTKGPGGFGNWPEMQQLLRNSDKVQGRGRHPNVFDGWNRFGPSDNYVSIYKGYLYCPVSGEYRFATTSDDASFLLLDGKMVVQWPGSHGAVADARHNAPARLQRGVRFFEYYHVDTGGGQVAEAAWRLPGEKDFAVIPPEAFVPLWPCQVIAYTQKDDNAPLDFSFWQESSLNGEGWLMSAVRFRVDFPMSARGKGQEWDFGDGMKTDDRNPVHVYSKPGRYSVKLTVSGRSVTQQVQVWPNEAIGNYSAEEIANQYARIVGSYNLADLDPDSVLAVLEFAGTLPGGSRLEQTALEGLHQNPASYSHVQAGERLLSWAEDFVRANNMDGALAIFDGLAKEHARREVSCMALHRMGQLLLAMEEEDRALAAFQDLDIRASNHQKFRMLALADMGDYYRHVGDAKRAREYYEKAAEAVPKEAGPIQRGGYSQAAVEYLRRDEPEAALEQIQRWELAFPLDRLDGYSSVLKGIALMKQGDYGFAFAELRDQVTANPDGNYAPHATLLMGDCMALGKYPEKAVEHYQRVINTYPESAVVRLSQQRLTLPPRSVEHLTFPIIDF